MKILGIECKKVDPTAFDEFCRVMREEVIPEVERVFAEREEAKWNLFYGRIVMPDEVEYYKIEKVSYKRSEVFLMTAAFHNCGLCGGVIDSHGGPGYGSICAPCGEALTAQKLRGCVVWDEDKTDNNN